MTDNTPIATKFQAFFEKEFRGRRIHALPKSGGTRTWDAPKLSREWIEPARPWMAKQPGCNFYFSPVRFKPDSTTSKKTDVQSSAWLWLDLDPREGQDLAAERETMLALLTVLLPDNIPTPTFIVDSGRGYWGLWKLKAPHVIDGPSGDQTRVFEATLRGLANAFGAYGDRSVINANRIVRLPGTINLKTGSVAEVVEFNAESYTIADFPSIIVERKARVETDAEPISTDLLKKMLDATPYVGGPKGLDDRRSYSGWLQFAMAVHEACGGGADGLAAFTDWCLADPGRGYDEPDAIQARWDSFDSEEAGGVTRASWTTLLASFGNADIVSDATPSPDAKEDFDDEETRAAASAPPPPTTPAIDLEKVKRRIKKLLKNTTKAGATPAEAATFLAKARELMEANDLTDDDLKKKKKEKPPTTAKMEDFLAYLPENKYIFIPTRELWPASTIASILGIDGAAALDRTRHTAIMAWCPGEELWIKDRLLVKGGWIAKQGSNTFNSYLAPPTLNAGDPKEAKRWVEHWYALFASEVAEHCLKVLAHKVRFPGVKINHGIIMGSDDQGIGKDSLIEPVVQILGEWNVREVTAMQSMDEKFNPHLEGLMCRISEANDLGEDNKYQFYQRRKTWMVTPPKVFSVADKHVKAHPVINVVLVLISTNDKAAIYIDPKDRRDYVAWSDRRQSDFTKEFFTELHAWYDNGGVEHVNAYLRSIDLSDFDPKAPPPKTAAWLEIVNADQSTQTTELDDLIDYLHEQSDDERPAVFTIAELIRAAAHPDARGRFDDALEMLQDKRQAKALSHKLARSGYKPVLNDADTTKGLWRVGGRRVVIYGRADLPMGDRLDAAGKLVKEMFVSDAAQEARARAARKAAKQQRATG